MKKLSRSMLYGFIVVLGFILVIQCLVMNIKQLELELDTAKLEYSASQKMYADLVKDYDDLNENYNELVKKCTDLENSLIFETTQTDSSNNEQLLIEPIAPSNEENNHNVEMPPEPIVDYYYASFLLENRAYGYYLSGEWDGTPTTIDEYETIVSLNHDGELRINDRSVAPTGFCYNHSLDLPPLLENANTQVFILGDGTYRLENNSIIKYSKGKEVKLSGGTLDWTGMDLENYRPHNTEFYYDEENDKLYIIASSIPYDLSNSELKRNSGIYLYIVPDRSKSEIEFVSQIRYTLDNYGHVEYDKSNIPNVKDICNSEEIYDFHFSRTCAFADGYIRESDEFPEGTFTHPVTTTPSVSLASYKG